MLEGVMGFDNTARKGHLYQMLDTCSIIDELVWYLEGMDRAGERMNDTRVTVFVSMALTHLHFSYASIALQFILISNQLMEIFFFLEL